MNTLKRWFDTDHSQSVAILLMIVAIILGLWALWK